MRIRAVFIIVTFILSAFIGASSLRAQTVECKQVGSGTSQEDIQKIINACNGKLNELSTKRNTLTNEIKYMDTQAYVTELEIGRNEVKIGVLKEEILNLDDRIEEIDTTVDKVSEIVTKKIGEIYKKQKTNTVLNLVDMNNLSNFLRSVEYLQRTQENDKQLLLKLQNTKVNFETQKDLREQKQEELAAATQKLEVYKNDLVQQQRAKQNLLTITQSDESKYQRIVSQLQAEIAGIRAIVSGVTAGNETELREVKKGDIIASTIQGASCNSSGTHLHYIVQQNGNVGDPFSYLKSIDNTNSSGGDPFNPSGNWDWPLSGPIELHQGYGETWAVRNTWAGNYYRFHNGIDITGSSSSVYSTTDGKLYKGAYSGASGCALQYVKVVAPSDGFVTFYLHVYSI